ncbi:MAG: hypothetical protein GF332_01685 [Candidatus Moranbacteria bacterium]|nr:hypothetical protein [Candidatus Moranbacteria bacterium]
MNENTYEMDSQSDFDTMVEFSSTSEIPTENLITWAIGFMVPMLMITVVIYVFYSFCLYKIAKKLNQDKPWIAWIPIAQFVVLLKGANLSPWIALGFLALIIPIVNFIVGIGAIILLAYCFMKVGEKLGYPTWVGLFVILPLGNIIIPAIFAFSGKGKAQASAQQSSKK